MQTYTFGGESYPETSVCQCGNGSTLILQTLQTYYASHEIHVEGTPIYECDAGHLKVARITKVRLKKLLRKAYKKKESTIHFESRLI